MGVLRAYGKKAIERKKYTLDYSCWLDTDEKLQDFAIVVSPATVPALIANGAYADSGLEKITTFLQGGLAGQTYLVSFIATTSIGQVKRDDLQMRVS